MSKSRRTSTFVPRARPWDSFALLSELRRSDVSLSDQELEPHIGLIEYDMYTEYDSQNLDTFLTDLAQKGVAFTPEFMLFRVYWKWDEWNHYLGYRRLYHLFTGESEERLHEKTVGRSSNFTPMAHLLADEFAICLVLAYDELVTRQSCTMDFDLFRSLGHKNFLNWIKLVGRDEGWHFWNVLNIIKLRHRSRLPEVEGVLERLVQWDVAQAPYYSTFVLDHDPERFSEAALRQCARKVLLYLNK